MPFPKRHEDTAQDVIRKQIVGMQSIGRAEEWGFVIYRCTYKSQEKWDTFMSIMQELAKEFLKDDEDLWKTLKWTVIEDPKLDGLNWLEVSTSWFVEWVEASLARQWCNVKALVDGTTGDDFPRREYTFHRYFIYVDEEVLDSFEDIEMASDPDGSGHFFTLVCLDYTRQLQATIDRRKRKLAGKPLPEDEQAALDYGDASDDEMPEEMFDSIDEDSRRDYWQRFKARDLVKAYASLSTDFWDLNLIDNEEEITEIFHL
jgi:hypothetical protein